MTKKNDHAINGQCLFLFILQSQYYFQNWHSTQISNAASFFLPVLHVIFSLIFLKQNC